MYCMDRSYYSVNVAGILCKLRDVGLVFFVGIEIILFKQLLLSTEVNLHRRIFTLLIKHLRKEEMPKSSLVHIANVISHDACHFDLRKLGALACGLLARQWHSSSIFIVRGALFWGLAHAPNRINCTCAT